MVTTEKKRGRGGGEFLRKLQGMVGSPAAAWKAFEKFQQTSSMKGLEDQELEDLGRFGATLVAATHQEQYLRAGFNILPWDRKGPGFPGFDHSYRMVVGGKTFYVIEPYDIGWVDTLKWREFSEQGWDITIGWGGALHFPGSTVPITFQRGKE